MGNQQDVESINDQELYTYCFEQYAHRVGELYPTYKDIYGWFMFNTLYDVHEQTDYMNLENDPIQLSKNDKLKFAYSIRSYCLRMKKKDTEGQFAEHVPLISAAVILNEPL